MDIFTALIDYWQMGDVARELRDGLAFRLVAPNVALPSHAKRAFNDARIQLGDVREGFVPRRLAPRIRGPVADLRCADAVGVVLEVLQGAALRADEATAEHVVAVTAHQRDALAVVMDLEATGRLAERARPVRGRGHARILPCHEIGRASCRERVYVLV